MTLLKEPDPLREMLQQCRIQKDREVFFRYPGKQRQAFKFDPFMSAQQTCSYRPPTRVVVTFIKNCRDYYHLYQANARSLIQNKHTVEAVTRCGGRILVNKVAIKPGKPLVLGRIGDVSYAGLPGNPAAAFTTFLVIVDDLLRTQAGMEPLKSLERPAIASFEWKGRSGRTVYLPAVVKGYHLGSPLIDLLPDANSGKLHLLSRADGFAVIGPNTSTVQRCDCIEWLPFR